MTVIERDRNHITPNRCIVTKWKCRCDCGNEVSASSQNLRSGDFRSCGCLHRENSAKINFRDLSGNRYGRLTVVCQAERSKSGQIRWRCRCDCGKEVAVATSNLTSGHTKSCGCFRDESRIKVHTKHGLRHTRIYSVWGKIKGRCYNKNTPCYDRYGGRGIKMCDEWRDNPEAFAKWAYENGFDENAEYGECTLERINNDGDYEPGNCKWASMREQSNNRRSNRVIEHNGEKHTLAEWTRILGVSNSKLIWHLNKGRTIQDVIDNYLG